MQREMIGKTRLWSEKQFWYGLIGLAAMVGGYWLLTSRVQLPQAGAVDAELVAAPQKGLLAPDFTLDTLAGATVRLSDLRGKPVLINFWASWCGPCRAEMPHIQAAHEAHGDDLIVLGVDQMEATPAVARFVGEFGLTFPIPLDSDGSVSEAYQARALPTSFFVGPDGVIRDIFIGPMTSGLLESKLRQIVNQGTSGETD